MGIKSNQVDALIGTADVHLNYVSTTQIALAGLAGTTMDIEVGGYSVDCSTPVACLTTDNLITSTGLDAGSGPAISTLYYAYVSNPAATFAPSDLRLSAYVPTTSNGYLGTSGNALNWRYVGMAYVNSATQFTLSGSACLVSSHFNRQPYRVIASYDDYSHTYAVSTWRVWNNSTSGRIHYVVPYPEKFVGTPTVITPGLFALVSSSAGSSPYVTIYLNGSPVGYDQFVLQNPSGTLAQYLNLHINALPSVGYYYQDLIEYNNTNTATFYGTSSYNRCLCWY